MISYVLLGLLVMIVGILMVPLDFYGCGSVTENFLGEIGLDWAGGLIKAHWVIPSQSETRSTVKMGPWVKSAGPRDTKTSSPKDKSRIKKSSKPNWNMVKSALDRQILQEILIYLRTLWLSLRLRADMEGRYGTDDPATTGLIAAIIGIFNPGENLRLTPQFAETGLDLRGNVRGRLIPGQIIWDLGRFLLKKPIRRFWWLMIRERNSKNKRR